MIALALALVLQIGARQSAPVREPSLVVRKGVTLAPDTVTVGEPFRVVLRLKAPMGATLEFPAGPDSSAKVEALDPRLVRDNHDSSSVDQSATYRFAAWDVGQQSLALGDAIVRLDGRERRVSFAELRVFVRSVLPADTALRVPKPARPLMELPRPWWIWLVAALAAIGLIGLFIWWWRRRRRAVDDAPDRDAYEVAEERFERIERLALVDAGERGRHVALMVDVLREYLARVMPEARVSLTTSELLSAVRDDVRAPTNRLAVVFSESDLIKFAARSVTAERARELGEEARAIASEVHERSTAPPSTQAEAA